MKNTLVWRTKMDKQKYIKSIYCVKDIDMGFQNPYEAPNNMMALRGFAEACQDEKLPLSKYPEKFELYQIGTMDSETGEIVSDLIKLAEATAYAKEIKS